MYRGEADIAEIVRRHSVNDRIFLICRRTELSYARGRLSALRGSTVQVVEVDD